MQLEAEMALKRRRRRKGIVLREMLKTQWGKKGNADHWVTIVPVMPEAGKLMTRSTN